MQLTLPFQSSIKSELFTKDDFLILPENSAVIKFLKKFFAQKDFAASQFPSLILKGAQGSGKSHILHIFAEEFGAEFLKKEKLSGVNPADFFGKNHFYILENIEEIKDEELVLRLINSAVEAKAFLILSARISPQFHLKDLTSRLKNIFAIEIKNPSHESVKMFLTNMLSRKQIKLSRPVIDFFSDNIERNFAAVLALVKLVELRVQESGKNVTMAEAKGMVSVFDGGY